MNLYTGGRWCPACRAEYRPGFGACSDCHVPLVDTLPDPSDGDHGSIREVTVIEIAPDARVAVSQRLTAESIPHSWDLDGQLTLPAEEAPLVESLLRDEQPPVPEVAWAAPEAAWGAPEPETVDDLVPEIWRRIAAVYVDWVVLALTAWPVSALLAWWGVDNPGDWFVLVAGAYWVVLTTWTGQTLGKKLLKMRVTDLGGGNAGPSQSLARYLIPAAPGIVASFVALPPGIVSASVLVYLPILWRTDRRGAHDLVAGTVVVRARADAEAG